MKKSLAALAVLGAFGASAMAANVSLYGVVDTGLMYTYQDTSFGSEKYVDGESKLQMKSGINAGSRFGLKGEEDLGNGMKVAFTLENQFNSDDGSLKNDRLFHREAAVHLTSQYGKLSFGRMGGVASFAGTYDLVYAIGDSFDGGDNNVLGLVISSRYDNMITYQTPKFAGLQATVQYSFQEDSKKEADATEGKSSSNRYASAAVTGEFGALNTVFAYEFENRNGTLTNGGADDGHTFYLGGNYDCGFAKTFAMVQYFQGARSAFGADSLGIPEAKYKEFLNSIEGVDGFGLHLGTQFQAAGGDVTVGFYYADGEADAIQVNDPIDLTYYGASARYEYPLSKRTTLYTGAGYFRTEIDDLESDNVQAYAGLTHKF